jgi:hypothetical protein
LALLTLPLSPCLCSTRLCSSCLCSPCLYLCLCSIYPTAVFH